MARVPLEEVPRGSIIFIDANILIYALGRESTECLAFLERCGQEEIVGVTTLQVLIETTHRLMLAEARKRGIIDKESAKKLKAKPAEIRGLTGYWKEMEKVLGMNLLIDELDEGVMRQAQAVRAEAGLLTNDSLIASYMKWGGLDRLASNDGDFDRVSGITRYSPTDLARSSS
jgi:predicted nucleic acid-binding protein